MRPFQIYRMKIPFKGCLDPRPWLIIEERPNSVFACLPFSTKHYDVRDLFEIRDTHPNFAATGLSRACFLICEQIQEVHRDRFVLDGRLQLKGQLEEELLVEFRKYFGI